jgi:hypothetical protein
LEGSKIVAGVTAGVEHDGQRIRRRRDVDNVARPAAVLDGEVVRLKTDHRLTLLVSDGDERQPFI